MKIQRILVPVDMTEKSHSAVDVAFDLATRFSAHTILLHVVETIEHITFEEMKDLYKRLEVRAETGLQKLSERFKDNGLAVDCVVTFGHRTREITQCAMDQRTDLIVMASHRVDPDRHDWSTISYGVAILAPCAVLLVK